MPEREIITRRRLPHWYVPGAAHFVTYRLFATLPQQALNELNQKRDWLLAQKPPVGLTLGQYRARVHKQLFAVYDDLLDCASDMRHLADPRIAAIVRSNLYHHHDAKYHLLAYCVMSNHVHALLVPKHDDGQEQASRLLYESVETTVGEQQDERSPLAKIMHRLKSYTAHEANKVLRRSGPFWQAESYDHWVRDEAELERVVDYIRANPVKAGLAKQPQDWFFCSCHDRFLCDGDVSGWLRWDS